jgi:hypothetical protein
LNKVVLIGVTCHRILAANHTNHFRNGIMEGVREEMLGGVVDGYASTLSSKTTGYELLCHWNPSRAFVVRFHDLQISLLVIQDSIFNFALEWNDGGTT